MPKALVLHGVNFATNALAQINLIPDVPCTGITLSDSTKNVTSLDQFTLTATVSPFNTTDLIVWSSSDTSVATVADGVVTPLKPGTVTITATCGNYTASCSVSVQVFIDPCLMFHYYIGRGTSTDGDFARVEGGPSTTTYGGSIKTVGSGRYAYDSNNYIAPDHAYPIMIPTGCTALKITIPDSYSSIKTSVMWCNSEEQSGQPDCVRMVSYEGNPWSSTAGSRTVNIPTEELPIDSFYLSAYLAGTVLTQDILDAITVEALYN